MSLNEMLSWETLGAVMWMTRGTTHSDTVADQSQPPLHSFKHRLSA